MQLLASHVYQQFQKNRQQPMFPDEIVVKIQRLGECFLGSALPFPAVKVIVAWNDLPNVMVDDQPNVKTELGFLRTPPPTPTGPALDKDGPTPSDPSSNGGCDVDGWLLVEDTTLSTSDVVVPGAPEGSATSEDDSLSRCSYPDQLLDRQINEEDPFPSTDSTTLSSDRDSLSSSRAGSPKPVGFDNTVNQWSLDYRIRGTDAFIESLVAFGVVSVGTALLASRIARAVVRKVAKISYTEGKSLENDVRFSVLEAFKKCWTVNDTSMEVSSTQPNTVPPTQYAINIASLMGSMFSEKISSSMDIHVCLTILLEGEKRFDCLCAMHALLVQANDKLCKNRNLPALMQFRDDITSTGGESNEYLWATTPRSKMLLTDILGLIDRWMVLQTQKREQSIISSWTGNRTIRNSAVGPRLRNPF
ncbi:hypothetical protein JVT61DRAFT_8321 [Boletus reticuloceps]|uniref:Uncharacterized protein n=1 Tax=Boletus reticuloceps TaxID=495285 RepID=A0A8I2YVG0_9AGAM|nr:hypothetical protein JVT61DRAFT_8321 [Boletus reticuloceps]